MEKIRFGNRSVGPGEQPYIIAELGSNHNGDMDLAKRLIDAAKDAGADCVKFQSWTKETIFSKIKYEENHFLADDYRARSDYSLERIVEAYSISEEQLLEMKRYADKVGIHMASTPFSAREAEFLVSALDPPFIKLASMDVDNLPFLRLIGSLGKPVVLSTGMSTLAEIDQAVRTIEDAGCNDVVILHCVSEYPVSDANVNLRRLDTLRFQFPEYLVGFSDHTLGTIIPIAAIALGAALIEKHFTLDTEMDGWDHKVSASPSDLATIASAAKRIPLALGDTRIRVVESKKRIEEFRRGAVATRALEPGHVLRPEDIDFKRPARGISPSELRYLLGRTLTRHIERDEAINWDHLS